MHHLSLPSAGGNDLALDFVLSNVAISKGDYFYIYHSVCATGGAAREARTARRTVKHEHRHGSHRHSRVYLYHAGR